ncbi:hypothetical protein ACP70R_012739 [Stipagrostis hirtigluma subsp. patula]
MSWHSDSFIVPGSLTPPVMPAPLAAAPARVLLDGLAYIGDRKNETFAQAVTRTGHTLGVSFWLAAPPAVSHLCFHCSGGVELAHLLEEPHVLCSGKDVAVIRVVYNTGVRPIQTFDDLAVPDSDYLVYRTRAGEPPSLDVLPDPKPESFHPWEIGLLPCGDGDGGEDFLMAVLRTRCVLLQYDLHVFSSKTNTWTTRLARLEPPSARYRDEFLVHEPDKVIALDGGVLGWVDLRRGVLLCSVLDADPVVRYIQFPRPMEGNMYLQDRARAVRDVTYSDGFIKLVEIEDQRSLVAIARAWNGPRSRASMDGYGFEVEDTSESYTPDGWIVVTWNRKLSWDRWSQDCTAYVNRSLISAELMKDKHNHSESSELKILEMAGPVWSVDGGDVVYLMAKADSKGRDACAVALNVRRSIMVGVTLLPAKRWSFFNLQYHPFALSKYLNMAADDCKDNAADSQIQEREDDRNNIMILVAGLDPSVTVNQLKAIVAKFGELRYLKIHADEQYGLVQFVSRSCAEQAISALNGTQIGRQSVRLSWSPSHVEKHPSRRRLREHSVPSYHP